MRSVIVRTAWFTLYCVIATVQPALAERADDLVLQPIQIAPDTYYVQGRSEMGSAQNRNFISNAGFVITQQGVVVIDALGSPSMAQALVAAIGKLTAQPIHTLIVTHYHADHIYGLQVFKQLGARIVAHYSGQAYLHSDVAQQRLDLSRKQVAPWVDAQTRLIAADHWIAGDYEFSLGGMRFVVKPVGPAHTDEDVAVLVPATGVLFAGDLVFRSRIPYVGSADSRAWIAALAALQAMAPKVIVPGHGAHSADVAHDVKFTHDYLTHLRDSMKLAALNLDSFDEAFLAADWSEYTAYPLFAATHRMNAYNVYLSIQREAP